MPHVPLLILASASPRRRELLVEAGYTFEVEEPGVVEPAAEDTLGPVEHVALAAWRKAAAVASRRSRGLILAADTVCAVDGTILGKPADRDDAERMIRLQEGRDSLVITGVCLQRAGESEWLGAVETSVCRFRHLTDAERQTHLVSGRWLGKAGAYGIQDEDPFVSVASGSRSNVVGLPMERLAALLRDYPGLTR